MPTFPTTRRSIIESIGSHDSAERARAFDTLVAIYWKPLYKYARLTLGRSPHDAEDLTQAFFTRVFEQQTLADFDPHKAAFRTYLRMLFERFAANEAKAAQRIKRGGGSTSLDWSEAEEELTRVAAGASPEDLFYRHWVQSVFGVAVARVRQSVSEEQFAIFEAYDLSDDRSISYRKVAEQFGIAESKVTNDLHAVRGKFREAILETLRDATASDEELRAEARALLGIEP